MLALELMKSGVFRRVRSPQPRLAADQLLVRVVHTGICGSDIAVVQGRHPYKRPPVVLGHEMGGVVEEVGAAVRGFEVGDVVTTSAFRPCGACAFCLAGDIHLCLDRENLSHEGRPGTFASHVVLDECMAYQIPQGVPVDQAALVEPLSIALHALRRTPVSGTCIALLGLGGIGAAAAVLARWAGCGHLTAVDLGSGKAGWAQALGVDVYLDASAGAPEDLADVTLVSATHPAALADAVRLTRRGGKVVVVAYAGHDVPVPIDRFVAKEVDILPSHLATRDDVETVIGLLAARQVDPSTLVTHRFRLDEIERAFDLLTRATNECLGRVLLDAMAEGEA